MSDSRVVVRSRSNRFSEYLTLRFRWLSLCFNGWSNYVQRPGSFWQWTECNCSLILSARNGTQEGDALFRTQGLENSREATRSAKMLPKIPCRTIVALKLVLGRRNIQTYNAATSSWIYFIDDFPTQLDGKANFVQRCFLEKKKNRHNSTGKLILYSDVFWKKRKTDTTRRESSFCTAMFSGKKETHQFRDGNFISRSLFPCSFYLLFSLPSVPFELNTLQ
jgi:hypothetical protein